jgi:predicted RNase H-like HicB family nuclease
MDLSTSSFELTYKTLTRVEMVKEPSIKLSDIVSVAFETNGKGYIGYLVELPGAFIRGRTEKEAIDKVDSEVNIYLKWLGIKQKNEFKIQIVQRHESSLSVEDADNEILLEADKEMMKEEEFRNLLELIWYSGKTFLQIYTQTKFKDWIDESRIRKTFYGENPKSIQEIFDHVKGCQYYYLSRTRIEFEEEEVDFLNIRKFCSGKLEDLYRSNNNSLLFDVDNELWTLKKVLRRFIHHDRIHGKAMIRILEKQRQLGIIEEYQDPFHFREVL